MCDGHYPLSRQGARVSARGFALLAVLWTLAAITVLAGAALTVARIGAATTRNRVLLVRAGWAREACAEILLARYARDPSVRRVAPVDLGGGVWCEAVLEDPARKVHLNRADRKALVTVMAAVVRRPAAAESLVDAALDWRDADRVPRPFGDEPPGARNAPFADVAELGLVRGFDDSLVARLDSLLTTRGTGAVNVTVAPRPVLATLPGMTAEATEALLARQATGGVASADALLDILSPGARRALLDRYADFVRRAVFSPPQLVGRVSGAVRGTAIVARATLTLVPLPGRLAVIRRETE